jgi:hypothetical protein
MRFFNVKRIYSQSIIIIFLIFLMLPVMVWSQPDPPDRTVGVLKNDAPYPGYNLFAPFRSMSVFLIDNNGCIINEWLDPDRLSPGAPVYLTDKGTLVKACYIDPEYSSSSQAGGRGGLIREYDWEGNLIWQYKCATYHTLQHHDFKILPNGNLLLIVYEFIELTSAEAASNFGYIGNLYSDGGKTGFQSEKIIEVKPDYKNWNSDLQSLEDGEGGTIVWEWHYLDHVIQDQVPSAPNYGIVSNHPELADINSVMPRFNAIDYAPDLEQIILSNSNGNEIWVIEHSESSETATGHSGGKYGKGGDLLYRWGNPQMYGAPGDQISGFQHTVYWLQSRPRYGHHLDEEGNFNILYFNNRGGDGGTSCVDEFIPPYNPDGSYVQPVPGEAFGPDGVVWRYDSGFLSGEIPSSGFISGVQRFPNGNTLVCSGATGTFFEVTRDGDLVWKYVNPVYNISPTSPGGKEYDCEYLDYDGTPTPRVHMVFRVTRYAEDFKGFRKIDMTPGYTLEHGDDEVLGKNLGDLASDAYSEVPDKFALSQNYPNPFNPETRIDFQLPEANHVELKIYNTLGEEVLTLANEYFEAGFHGVKWDGTDNGLKSVPTGVYIYQLRAGSFMQVKKMMLLK